METVQGPVPLQPSPVQPTNVDPASANTVNVTDAPLPKLAVQIAPQSIPAGMLVMVPLPVPLLVIVNVAVAGTAVKSALTICAPFMVTTQPPVPLQPPPLHPAKLEPASAIAVKVIALPVENPALHVLPQLIPAGALVTVPVPVPVLVIVRTSRLGGGLKVAVTA